MPTKIQPRRKTKRVGLSLDPVSMTEQSHAGEANINSIMRKYRKTGVLPQVQSGSVYGDFATEDDYHSTQDKLIAAQNQFMELPSEIRTRFQNDPGSFYGFVNDPENLQEAIKLGLLADPDIKDPIPVGTPIKPLGATSETHSIPAASSDPE